ncbi:hypothetical protein [Variovorax sp. Root434]|uniref:hypothetical protein n=1 Tax=Variovorax sp. Root434 TaxID=1736536 RepID=UPI0006FF773B|nr:hypothetical protein [Variovorax sp. Root434]KQX21211.1 hypothetical protein ASD05_16670 [Variovorax sp. Root434]
MRSYYPRFREGADPGLVPKLGGLPWGLPRRLWPVCRECNRAMSHLAQLPTDGEALPLAEGEVLFLFKCEWDSICSFWEHDAGANAAFAVPRTELGAGPTAPPADSADGPPPLLREIAIAGWRADDDGAPAEMEEAFYDYQTHFDLPQEVAHPHDWASAWRTKSGGVPYWTANGAQGMPAGRLLLQIDNWIDLVDGGGGEVANFCSDGTAYVFVDRAQAQPVYSMFINR